MTTRDKPLWVQEEKKFVASLSVKRVATINLRDPWEQQLEVFHKFLRETRVFCSYSRSDYYAVLWRRTGSVEPGRQGHPVRSKLDAHEAFIMALVEAGKDITLTEIAERLRADRGVQVSRALVWYFFDKRGVTFKNVWPAPFARSWSLARVGRAQMYPA
ncbi:hypothetical protein [Acuticoccus sp. I52.16.1]|uniref:hypothetical protein n=1 Tax=Acuticoccus sp. I52.16.1 TaxID=2928472 RepID=UPI001FD51ED1|nr:hypothetical protein [Acuticoccus sp. I52.16.1]UOM36738.1 hypothetical protein MRB58_11335 [Acuticoccus sp. I52.16.1]